MKREERREKRKERLILYNMYNIKKNKIYIIPVLFASY
jgi:hypothetical protein